MDTVIVVIPVYNVESYVSDCIDSVINQTYKKIRIILVDDGSKDSSGEICDRYKALDERITVIHKKNGGLSSARNAGIQWAINNKCGEWICFIDSDDWIHPEYVEQLLNAAKKYNSPVSICYYSVSESRIFSYKPISSEAELWKSEDAYTLKSGIPCAYAWNKFYKIDCFNEVRFPEGKYWEDLFTTHRIVLPLKSIPVIKEPLYFYYKNPHGIVYSKWADKNLDFYEANNEYIDYLKRTHCVSAEFYTKALEQYVFVLYVGFKKVKDLGAVRLDGKPHYKVIQEYARKALKEYFSDLSKDEKVDLIRIIYPSLFKFLFSLKRMIRK